MIKGMSFNVSLSDEQMEYLAGLTADKVNQTRSYDEKELEFARKENDRLKRSLTDLKIKIANDVILESKIRERLELYKEKCKELQAFKKAVEYTVDSITMENIVSNIEEQ